MSVYAKFFFFIGNKNILRLRRKKRDEDHQQKASGIKALYRQGVYMQLCIDLKSIWGQRDAIKIK